MKCAFVFITLCGVLLVSSDETHFHNHADDIKSMFKANFAKFHGHDGLQRLLKRSNEDGEMEDRMKTFRKAVEVVEDCNDNKNTRYTCKLNFVSVMTAQEQKDLLDLDRLNTSSLLTKRSSEPVRLSKRQLPASVNWLTRGAQPPVKNQGRCGSCWAFGAVSALEGRYFALTGEMIPLSEQEYLDCTMEHFYAKHKSSWAKDHSGCKGGWMHWAYDYSKDTKRMASMAAFPYKAEDRACNMANVPNAMTKADVTGVKWYKGSDARLAEGVVEGVVTVAIKVESNFNYYRTGIFECNEGNKCNCGGHANHAVTVTGYAADHWMVRNSWGSGWGAGGYIKMSRAQDNICGINAMAQAPALTCKQGQTCNGWKDGDGEDEEEEEEEEEEEDKDFDVGKDIMCGDIKHFGGLCVDIDDTTEMNAVLTSAGCSRTFCYTSKGYLKDRATEKCLTVTNTSKYDENVRFGACSTAQTWNMTAKGFQVKAESGFCWHPQGGAASPAEDTNVVIWSGCDEDRLTFQIKRVLCWEECGGMKMGKRIKVDGKTLRGKKLQTAKEKCMEDTSCKGIYYNQKTHLLSAAKKMKPAKNDSHKSYKIVPCDESCDAGTMRCKDGKCRQKCQEDENEDKKDDEKDEKDDKDECPGGTTKCKDGVCRHEHMCEH